MKRSAYFEYVGFTSLLAVAVVLIYMVQMIFANPEFCEQIENSSPWISHHVDMTSYFIQGAIFFVFLALPPYLISKDMNTENSRLSIIGYSISVLAVALTISYFFINNALV